MGGFRGWEGVDSSGLAKRAEFTSVDVLVYAGGREGGHISRLELVCHKCQYLFSHVQAKSLGWLQVDIPLFTFEEEHAS